MRRPMAESYTTAIERVRARLVAKGISPDRALNAAEKQASAKRKIANPGQKGRKVNKRHTFKRGTDPVPPKEKKPMRHEDIKKFAENMVMEIHGITGLIGGPTGAISGGSSGTSSAGSENPSSKSKPLSTKYNQQEPDDVTKKKGSGNKPTQGFKANAGRAATVPRAKAGSVTTPPPTMEDIEKEFGIT